LTRVWAKRGTRPRAPRDQRHEWAYLFGAVCPERRAAAALVMPTANAEVLSLHMAEIARNVAPARMRRSCSTAPAATSPRTSGFPPNITLVFLPRYAPEPNPMENVWEYLRGNKLAITIFDSYEDILNVACDAWMFFENDKERIATIATRSWTKVTI